MADKELTPKCHVRIQWSCVFVDDASILSEIFLLAFTAHALLGGLVSPTGSLGLTQCILDLFSRHALHKPL